MIAVLSVLILNTAKSQEINIDSLYYSDVDSLALAKQVEIDEANYHWTDTVEESSYAAIDKHIRSIKKRYKNIPALAKDITAPYNKEEDKIRAIFIWVSNNIAYDCKEYHNKNRRINGPVIKSNDDKYERAAKWADIYYKYASTVLKKRKGICEGYSCLFYELCKVSGVKCEVVHGKVKKEKNGKYRYASHAWNKVYMNEEWFFLDPTWASGCSDEKVTKYYKSFSNTYYLTPIWRPFETHIANEKQTKRRNDLVGNY
jgi:transglutaminase/protease-like cytokinesis protein 3